MVRKLCLLVATTLAGACATAWWQSELQAWEGAPVAELIEAWGPPLRTLTDESGRTLLVFEGARELDPRLDALRSPGATLVEEPMQERYLRREQGECILRVEIVDDRVARVEYTGAPCDVAPRDPARRKRDPVLRQR